MSDNSIVTFEQLQEMTGFNQKGAIKRHLMTSGVSFFETPRSLYTTVELLNSAGGLVQNINPEVEEAVVFISKV
jgi:hypothetical protein|tara:strand:- start:3100 stop:3321 length:222 start_codon:yes stop_codon:yes gene_type:complete